MRTTTSGFFGGVQVGLLLGFADVLLVADAFVAEPVRHLFLLNSLILGTVRDDDQALLEIQ